MVDYKRFYVSVRNNNKIIATEKRRNDIDRRLIKPWEVMIIKADNMNDFFVKLKSTFGSTFRHHRRHGSWIINFDNHGRLNDVYKLICDNLRQLTSSCVMR